MDLAVSFAQGQGTLKYSFVGAQDARPQDLGFGVQAAGHGP